MDIKILKITGVEIAKLALSMSYSINDKLRIKKSFHKTAALNI